MDERRFWAIVEKAGSPDTLSPDEQCNHIVKQLRDITKGELLAFFDIHQTLHRKAYTWSLLKACLVTIHYASDDVFEDFRNWLILNGRERFYNSIENPDFIATYILLDDPSEDLSGEALMYVYEKAFRGNIQDLEKGYNYFVPPDFDVKWPTQRELKQEFPQLYERYSNDSVYQNRL